MSAQATKKRQRTKKTSSTSSSSSSLQKEKKEKKSVGPKEITCDFEDGRLKANGKVIGMLCYIGPGDLASYISSRDHNLTNAEKIQAWQFAIEYYGRRIEKMKETCNKLLQE